MKEISLNVQVLRGAMRDWRIQVGFVASMALAIGWVQAGPILPQKPRPSDEVLSLAGLKAIKVVVSEMPSTLTDAGITTEQTTALFKEILTEFGFVVRDEPDWPRLVLQTGSIGDPDIPGSVGVLITLEVYQMGVVDRISRQLALPTTSFSKITLTTKDQVADSFRRDLRFNAQSFSRYVQWADAAAP